MKSENTRGNWNDQKNKLKRQFPVLTDEDLQFEADEEEEMFEKIQIKIGKTKEELLRIIASL